MKFVCAIYSNVPNEQTKNGKLPWDPHKNRVASAQCPAFITNAKQIFAKNVKRVQLIFELVTATSNGHAEHHSHISHIYILFRWTVFGYNVNVPMW